MSIKIIHNAGFFSCCSVKLSMIIDYINLNKKFPCNVDSSEQFEWYKPDTTLDITEDYFLHYNDVENIYLDPSVNIDYHWGYQFINYSDLNYGNIIHIIKKYFSPSNNITDIIKNIESKYNLQYDNICVLFYRGNDKNTETKICGYEEYINYGNQILKENPNIIFLIQSDETEFIELCLNTYPNNSFYFKDETRHMKKCNSTVDIVMKDKNYIYSKYYLAITIIMSKCKYIICGSGNCSIWIMFYRENAKNVYQNLNDQWLIN
jgi:hypothetical protein